MCDAIVWCTSSPRAQHDVHIVARARDGGRVCVLSHAMKPSWHRAHNNTLCNTYIWSARELVVYDFQFCWILRLKIIYTLKCICLYGGSKLRHIHIKFVWSIQDVWLLVCDLHQNAKIEDPVCNRNFIDGHFRPTNFEFSPIFWKMIGETTFSAHCTVFKPPQNWVHFCISGQIT